MMEVKLLFIVILALVPDFSVGFPHRHHHRKNMRRHSDSICKSPGLKLAIRLLQIDTEDIKYNIRCRMDPGTCSENMLTLTGGALTTLELNDTCNTNFLQNLRISLGQFYTKFSRIRAHITRLQSDLTLSTADPLQTLTNKLCNDIRNAIQTSQPHIPLPSLLPETSADTNVESSEWVMLVDFIQTINDFDHFIGTSYNTLNLQ